MKKTLITCLIGAGLLLTATSAKSIIRTIDVFIEDYVLEAESNTKEGLITEIDIYDLDTQQEVISEQFDAYKADVNLSSLPSGDYEAVVTAQFTQTDYDFKL